MPADLAVIGLGHLGLPLARAAVTAGIDTVGYDPDPRPYAELGAGRSPVEGTLTAAEIRRMLS
ncbi:nucleotide sugar dehydrogenase, partial [Streptomyces sp. SID7499]|nr:nucleotide sugar dehydrogenase [Streptomyces sp. SID7499]